MNGLISLGIGLAVIVAVSVLLALVIALWLHQPAKPTDSLSRLDDVDYTLAHRTSDYQLDMTLPGGLEVTVVGGTPPEVVDCALRFVLADPAERHALVGAAGSGIIQVSQHRLPARNIVTWVNGDER